MIVEDRILRRRADRRELPETVVLEMTEADAVVKGQTASSSYKPALLENGVRTMVPPHIETGTRVVINTADGSYVERAKVLRRCRYDGTTCRSTRR